MSILRGINERTWFTRVISRIMQMKTRGDPRRVHVEARALARRPIVYR